VRKREASAKDARRVGGGGCDERKENRNEPLAV